MSSLGSLGFTTYNFGEEIKDEQERKDKKRAFRNNLLMALANGLVAAGSRDPGAVAARLINQAADRRQQAQQFQQQRELEYQRMFQSDKQLNKRLFADEKTSKREIKARVALQEDQQEATAALQTERLEADAERQLNDIRARFNLQRLDNKASLDRLREQMGSAEGRQRMAIEASMNSQIVESVAGELTPQDQVALHAALRAYNAGDTQAFAGRPDLQTALQKARQNMDADRASARLSQRLETIGQLDDILNPTDITGARSARPEDETTELFGKANQLYAGMGGNVDPESGLSPELGQGFLDASGLTTLQNDQQNTAMTDLQAFSESLALKQPMERDVSDARQMVSLMVKANYMAIEEIPEVVTAAIPKLSEKDVQALIEGLGIVQWTAENLPQDVKRMIHQVAVEETGGVGFATDSTPWLIHYAEVAKNQGLMAVREELQKRSANAQPPGMDYNFRRP